MGCGTTQESGTCSDGGIPEGPLVTGGHKLRTNNHDDRVSDLSVAPAPPRTLDFLSSRMAPHAATVDDQKDAMYAMIGRGQDSQQGKIDAECRDRERGGWSPLEKGWRDRFLSCQKTGAKKG